MLTRQQMTVKHKKNLARLRRMTCALIEDMEEVLISGGMVDENSQYKWKYMWGDKENVASALTKLTTLLTKIIPMEQEMVDYQNMSDSNNSLSDDDALIMKYYFEKIAISLKNEKL